MVDQEQPRDLVETTPTVPIRERIKTFPTEPGCYLMKDRDNRVVYVGKAANLRARLRSYFARSGDNRFFVRLLDQVLSDIEVVITSNATEALLVENELIKTYQPRFNVRLKDDKHFLNLRLATGHDYPRLEIVRRRKKDGARYFGPYASATSIRSTLRLINRHFQLRTCSDSEFKNRSRPCLEHQIKRCPAPCVYPVALDEYQTNVDHVVLFLEGRGDQLAAELREKMSTASTDMAFERAAHFRDQARAVERCLERQDVVMRNLSDLDVLGIGREGPTAVIHLQCVRAGRVKDARTFKLGKNEAPDDVLLSQFIYRYYGRAVEYPPLVLVPVTIEDSELCAQWLSDLRGTRVQIKVPQRGEKRRMVLSAARNAQNSLRLDSDRAARNRELLRELQQQLRLVNFPERIECYDISNVQGTEPVASMVVTTDGEADKAEYRRFHIRGLQTPNDFQMMFETLSRRLTRMAKGEWEKPDLIVIDGGRGQLNIALQVLRELAVDDIDVIGLAKSRVTNNDPNTAVERSPERVFLPNVKDPVVLRQNSAALYLLTRLRDEAHRFAITFHRNTRRASRLGSSLDRIEGIGPSRRKALLKHFGSVQGVRNASIESLLEVPGISRSLAERIYAGV